MSNPANPPIAALPNELPGAAAWSPRARNLAGLIIVLGALLRIGLALVGRPLWHDEAMLGANILERDYAGLLQPLDYGQVAPVGYLVVQRFLVNTLGDSELSLRWMSLLPALAALPLYLLIVRRLLPPRAALLALLLASFSEPLIYYAMEAKPYSLDVLAGLLFFWLALRAHQGGCKPLDVALMAAAGSLGLLFSYVLIFLVATTGAWLVAAHASGRQTKQAVLLAAACAVCGVVFLILKMKFMGESDAVRHHKGFWEGTKPRGFMPLPPHNFNDLVWFIERPFDFFIDPMRYKAFGLALGLALAGAAAMWRGSRLMVALLVTPVPLIALVSATKMYPFGTQSELRHPILGRVLLPFVPLMLVLMARGLHAMWNAAGRHGKFIVAGALLILWVHPMLKVMSYAKDRDEPHDARPAMRLLSKQVQPGDAIYVNYTSLMLSRYYGFRYPLKDVTRFTVSNPDAPLEKTIDAYWTNPPAYSDYERTIKLAAGRRVWVFLVHTPDLPEHRGDEKFMRWYLPTVGKRLTFPGLDGKPVDYWTQGNATLQLYELNPAAK